MASSFSLRSAILAALAAAAVPEVAAADPPAVKTIEAILRAIWPTEVTWSKMMSPQIFDVLAAPIPHSTQSLGGEAQQTGPTPLYPALHFWQQSPALFSWSAGQLAVQGVPIISFFAQERSIPPLNPKELQLGVDGLQMQHPKAQNPDLHFGQTIAPHHSQFPTPWSASHLRTRGAAWNQSDAQQGYPAPLPYSASLQKSPSFLHPQRQFCWQSRPTRVYPAGHLSQQRSPSFSRDPQSEGIFPTPLPQLSFQQNSAWDVICKIRVRAAFTVNRIATKSNSLLEFMLKNNGKNNQRMAQGQNFIGQVTSFLQKFPRYWLLNLILFLAQHTQKTRKSRQYFPHRQK